MPTTNDRDRYKKMLREKMARTILGIAILVPTIIILIYLIVR